MKFDFVVTERDFPADCRSVEELVLKEAVKTGVVSDGAKLPDGTQIDYEGQQRDSDFLRNHVRIYVMIPEEVPHVD